jgi:anti-sigma regulatory factor (Ser/Thr protein kinase)
MISSSPPSAPERAVVQEAAPPSERCYAVLCPRGEIPRIQPGAEPGRTVFAHRLIDLVELIEREPMSVALLHTLSVREADYETARILRYLPSRPLVAALGGRESMDRAFGTASRLGIGGVFPDDCLQHPIDMELWTSWLENSGPGLGLGPHLDDGAVTFEIEIQSRADKSAAISEVLSCIGRARPDTKFLFELRLILEETINNAIFHAFCDSAGREKYRTENFTRLERGETVRLEFGSDSRSVGICVTDNQGRLHQDTILGKVQRQLSAQGIFDQSGRGLYLVYSLSGRLLFNLRSGKLTQVVVLFPTTEDAWSGCCANRPLMIFNRA